MSRLVSMIRFVLGFVVIMVCSLVTMVAVVLMLPFRVVRVYLCNVWGHVVGRSIMALAGVTPVVKGRERLNGSMPAIFAMNHASTLDAFSGVWLCPYGGCGVYKKEIVRVPFYGQLAWMSGHLLLDRANTTRAVETMKSFAVFMRRYRLGLWIFPEGTRSRDGRLQPFKKGFVHLAIATGLPVVPVVVHGSHRNWVPGKFTFNPMQLDIEVLEPISTADWKEDTAADHARSVYEVFARALREDQKPLSPPAEPELKQPPVRALPSAG